jgi:hypothetical protein
LPAEEYLTKEIERLERQLRSEERRLRDIVQNPPYTLREMMQSQTWLDAERIKLEADIADKERDALRSQQFLASIHAEWKGVPKSTDAEEQDAFTNDFMENTYFSVRG